MSTTKKYEAELQDLTKRFDGGSRSPGSEVLAIGAVLRGLREAGRGDVVSSASSSGSVEGLTLFNAYVAESDGLRLGIPSDELLDGHTSEHPRS